MNDTFRTIEDYELYLYSLPERFQLVRQSTLVFVRRGATLARFKAGQARRFAPCLAHNEIGRGGRPSTPEVHRPEIQRLPR